MQQFYCAYKELGQGDFYFSTEAVVRRCSVKTLFLEISQNSKENTCARVSFLIIFFTEHLRWLLLIRSGKSFHPLQFIYSLPQKNHAYLNLVYSICHRVNIYRLVKLLVSSPPSTTTLRFIDSSSMDISLGKSTKFPIPSSSSSTVKTLSEGLTSSSMKIWFSLDNIWASHDLRKKFPTFYLMSYTYLLFQLCPKICKQIIWHLFSISQIITRWLVN